MQQLELSTMAPSKLKAIPNFVGQRCIPQIPISNEVL
jgi:hypothetical protein